MLREVVRMLSISSYGLGSTGVTGPLVFSVAFKVHFKDPKLKIRPQIYPGGVRLLARSGASIECLVNQIFDIYKGEPLHHIRFPRYYEEMEVYSNKPHYGWYYANKAVYNESIKIESDGKYLIEDKVEEENKSI
jgi:hypothetical protein